MDSLLIALCSLCIELGPVIIIVAALPVVVLAMATIALMIAYRSDRRSGK